MPVNTIKCAKTEIFMLKNLSCYLLISAMYAKIWLIPACLYIHKKSFFPKLPGTFLIFKKFRNLM